MAFPSTAPIAYYKLDESSGNASDSVNSYTLTNTNSASYATGLINNGVDFGTANTNQQLQRTGEPATTINGGNFTINFWVKSNVDGTYPTLELECTTNGTWFRAYAGIDDQNNRWLAGWHGGGQIASALTISTSVFYMVTITNSSGTLTLYGNGVSKGSTSTHYGSNLGATDSFSIGYADGVGAYGSGMFDEVGIWNSVLSGTEITDLYNGGAGVTYPTGPTTEIKTINGLAIASVKTVNGLSTASVKTVNGLA